MKSRIYQVMVREDIGLLGPLELLIYIKREPDEQPDPNGWGGTEEIRRFICKDWSTVTQQINAAEYDLRKWD